MKPVDYPREHQLTERSLPIGWRPRHDGLRQSHLDDHRLVPRPDTALYVAATGCHEHRRRLIHRQPGVLDGVVAEAEEPTDFAGDEPEHTQRVGLPRHRHENWPYEHPHILTKPLGDTARPSPQKTGAIPLTESRNTSSFGHPETSELAMYQVGTATVARGVDDLLAGAANHRGVTLAASDSRS
jgi:hypothetical protein